MSDRISLQGVQAFGTHGVLEHEQKHAQPFVVDVDLDVDLFAAGTRDDLAESVSYADVADDVVRIIEGPSVQLIETLAERIAAAVLLRPGVEAVEVCVHKPRAPIPVPFADVCVRIRRETWRPAVIALGANRGDSLQTLTSAVRHVAALSGVRVRATSQLFDTDPVGGPEQPAYLNAVMLIDTRLAPHTLLRRLSEIENSHGRVRTVRWGARSLDLDIIQLGDPTSDSDLRVQDEVLTLPHPRAHERTFVLLPWLQVEPQAQLRVGSGVRAVGDLVAELDPSGALPGVRQGPAWHPLP
ncbi:2-amino-4-hydroxy-6-hydroxymethyldihydropteridine diphosphokinase [Gephyromycinifex aptenodytis]|uniref:2-amino-4-hydroxy-6- hydroxymethyldihydropteridine diphosphokinase n=1 Tax=Gephyromycinifex aptenodytis TaxID=2716227 RepID=UPI001446CBFF|nr:2-amino-4-hydroxy-6-hydroxymethyldihydropteridine diphosphokinase [Gephyromycinifex aptenodytis]